MSIDDWFMNHQREVDLFPGHDWGNDDAADVSEDGGAWPDGTSVEQVDSVLARSEIGPRPRRMGHPALRDPTRNPETRRARPLDRHGSADATLASGRSIAVAGGGQVTGATVDPPVISMTALQEVAIRHWLQDQPQSSLEECVRALQLADPAITADHVRRVAILHGQDRDRPAQTRNVPDEPAKAGAQPSIVDLTPAIHTFIETWLAAGHRSYESCVAAAQAEFPRVSVATIETAIGELWHCADLTVPNTSVGQTSSPSSSAPAVATPIPVPVEVTAEFRLDRGRQTGPRSSPCPACGIVPGPYGDCRCNQD